MISHHVTITVLQRSGSRPQLLTYLPASHSHEADEKTLADRVQPLQTLFSPTYQHAQEEDGLSLVPVLQISRECI